MVAEGGGGAVLLRAEVRASASAACGSPCGACSIVGFAAKPCATVVGQRRWRAAQFAERRRRPVGAAERPACDVAEVIGVRMLLPATALLL